MQTAKFPVATHEIVSTPSAVVGSRVLNKLNKDCITVSKQLTPLVLSVVVGTVGFGVSSMLSFTSGVVDHPEVASFKATLPIFSILFTTAGMLVLSSVTSINTASITMAEYLIDGGDEDDNETDGVVTSLRDADLAGEDTLTSEQTMQLEIRQMFLCNAVIQQNGGNGMCVNLQKFVAGRCLDNIASLSPYGCASVGLSTGMFAGVSTCFP